MPISVHAAEAPLTYDRVHLRGTATGEVANDTLVATLFVQREGATAADLAAEVNAGIAWALERAGSVPGVKSQTLGYQTQPVYRNQRIDGWRVRQSLRLESRDAEGLAALLGVLQERVALESVRYTVSANARRDAEDALIVEALAAFRARAELVRRELDASGYRIVELHIDGNGPQPRPAMAAMEMRAAAAPPALEPGTREVGVSVNGTVELEHR